MSERRARAVLASVVFVVLLAQALLYPGVDTLVAALGANTVLDGILTELRAIRTAVESGVADAAQPSRWPGSRYRPAARGSGRGRLATS